MEKPAAKRQRVEISVAIKKAIVEEKSKNPAVTQQDLIQFAKTKFDIVIGRSTVSDILKTKDRNFDINQKVLFGQFLLGF